MAIASTSIICRLANDTKLSESQKKAFLVWGYMKSKEMMERATDKSDYNFARKWFLEESY